MNPRWALLLLLLGLLALGVAWWVWRLAEPPSPRAPVKMSAGMSPPQGGTKVAGGATATKAVPTTWPVAEKANERSADAVARARSEELMAGQMESVVRAALKGLIVTETEMKALGRAYAMNQLVRAEYEAGIATVAASPEVVTITIPPYPEAGARLKERFIAEMNAAVGPELGATLGDRIGLTMETLFQGFGQDSQVLTMRYQGKTETTGEAYYTGTLTRTAVTPRAMWGGGDGKFNGSATSSYGPLDRDLDGGGWMHYAEAIRALRPGAVASPRK